MAKKITLPSGKVAEIEKGKGVHVREAQKVIKGDSSKYMFALIAALTKIDGQSIFMEDLDDMDMPDVMALMAEVSEGNFTSSPEI